MTELCYNRAPVLLCSLSGVPVLLCSLSGAPVLLYSLSGAPVLLYSLSQFFVTQGSRSADTGVAIQAMAAVRRK